jgi:hypothetical protein
MRKAIRRVIFMRRHLRVRRGGSFSGSHHRIAADPFDGLRAGSAAATIIVSVGTRKSQPDWH